MLRVGVILVAGILLLGDGILFGLWTNRWQTPNELEAGVASLDRVPLVIGDWQGQPLPNFSERIVAQAGFAGYWQRRYENKRNGGAVSVLLACGPFGPLSVHTPEVCFAGNGLTLQSKRSLHIQELAPAAAAQFWKAKFGKPESNVTGHLLVYWSWNAGDGWRAPENPRFAFGGAPVLYKLYVTHEVLGEGDQKVAENCQAFFRDFLPALEKNLAFKP